MEGMGKLPTRELSEVKTPSLDMIERISRNKGMRKFVEATADAKRRQEKLLVLRRQQHQRQLLQSGSRD